MFKKNTEKKNKTKRKKLSVSGLISWIIILVLLLLIAAMVMSQVQKDARFLDFPRKIVAYLLTPMQKTFSQGTDAISGYLRTLKLRGNIEKEYNDLLAKYEEQVEKAMLADEYKNQLQNYADLDDEMKRNMNLKGVKANVIGRDPSNYSYTLTIDVGKDQGIEDHMAVVVPGALIGYTYDVTKDRALVKGIVDKSCSIAGLIESNRDQGTVSGTLSIDGKYACRMYYLSYTTLPRPGDRVVTSGVGMEFPKGIPIGYVRESTRGLDDSKQYIVIEPIADFGHIEYVIVYRYRPSHAEAAQARGEGEKSTFIPLPGIKPVPTLIGQPAPSLSPETDQGESPSPSPSPTLGPTPKATSTPNAGTPTNDYIYHDYKPGASASPGKNDGLATSTPAPSKTPIVVTLEDDN